MKVSKNYLSAVSGVMILVVSFVLSAPRPINAFDSHLSRTTKPVVFFSESTTTRLPVSDSVARRTLANSSIWQAAVADTSDDLSIDASFGDENISLERKKHRGKGCN